MPRWFHFLVFCSFPKALNSIITKWVSLNFFIQRPVRHAWLLLGPGVVGGFVHQDLHPPSCQQEDKGCQWEADPLPWDNGDDKVMFEISKIYQKLLFLNNLYCEQGPYRHWTWPQVGANHHLPYHDWGLLWMPPLLWKVFCFFLLHATSCNIIFCRKYGGLSIFEPRDPGHTQEVAELLAEGAPPPS